MAISLDREIIFHVNQPRTLFWWISFLPPKIKNGWLTTVKIQIQLASGSIVVLAPPGRCRGGNISRVTPSTGISII